MCVLCPMCTHSGGVLLLLVQSGAASLLAVAVLLQGVEHLVGQLQVHAQPVAHVDLWSKLQHEERVDIYLSVHTMYRKAIQANSGSMLQLRSLWFSPSYIYFVY